MGEYNGHKYYFSNSNYSWTDAKANALSVGGQMLVIDDAEENDFVNSIMIHNGTWIGTSRPSSSDSWSNVYGAITYTNWSHENGGGNIDDVTGYGVTYGGEWYTHNNNDGRHYILEYGPSATSELESSILVEYTGDAVLDTDYSVSSTVASIPAGQQKNNCYFNRYG
jgi:hypothetical protein